MAHRHLQPGIMRPWLERTFPYSGATAMTPTPIGHDASRFGFGIHHPPHVVPPSLETGARQVRRILITPHAHPALIGGHVVDPRGKRRAQDLIHAIRHPHLLGWSCWLPCPPTSMPHAFFLGSTERRGC